MRYFIDFCVDVFFAASVLFAWRHDPCLGAGCMVVVVLNMGDRILDHLERKK